MIPDFPGVTALLVSIALAPAILRWWWGRALLAHANDPALPERMLAVARRSRVASGMAMVPLIALSPRSAAWTLPLLALSRLVAAYPSRRALFEEHWGLIGYLSFWLRLFAGAYGLWIVMALLPLLVPLAGGFDWLAGLLLAIVLLAWNTRSAEVVRRVLRARPIESPALLARFGAMAQAAGVPAARFERVDVGGGALANAAALPSRREPVVIFTDPLLEQLAEAEIVAICAHELAHHEYYSPSRVRRMRLVNAAFIVSGAALAPVVRAAGMPVLHWASLLWYAGFLLVAASRARHRQRHETVSDLRAVALCGDGEALVRGLTRLYTLGRVPRRLDPQLERQATHPSLARRIRDIRRAAGVTASALREDARFTAPAGDTVVTFQPDRLQWVEGESASHSLSYAHLSEVRVTAAHAGPSALVVVERGGRRWTMPLETGDVARAQAVLDLVDGRLSEPAPAPRVRPNVTRVIAALAMLLALPVGQIAAALLAALVAMRPSPPLVAAAGLGTLVAAALTIRNHGIGGSHSLLALLLLFAAASLLGVARAARREDARARAAWPLALLAVSAALSVAALAAGGLDAVTLHESARSMSAPLVWSVALAGALLWTRSRPAIAAAAAAAAVAAFLALAASSWFLDRFGHDPLLVRGGAVTGVTLHLFPFRELRLPFFASTLRLSPSARVMAIGESGDGDTVSAPAFHVGDPGGTLVPLTADDLRFVDDERVLLLVTGRDGLELREVAIAPPNRILWLQQLPPLGAPRLSLNTADLSWRLLGWNRARDIIRFEGQIGDAGFRETRWSGALTTEGYASALAAAGDDVVVVESRYDLSALGQAEPRAWPILPFLVPRMESTLRSISRAGRRQSLSSHFAAQCVPDPASGKQLVCSVFDGTDTRVMALSARGEVSPLGTLPGRFFGRDAAGRGWIIGWGEASPLALRLSTREAFRVEGARGEWIADVGAGDETFATLGYGGRGSIVRMYSTEKR